MSDHFDAEEFEDALLVLAREKIQNECSCGAESTRSAAHREDCSWRLKAERYARHAADRVGAAEIARARADAAAAAAPPTPRLYTEAEVALMVAAAGRPS